MLTRCPACQTVFRLSAEQLAARGGKVRCGHCFHPFQAQAHELGNHPLPPPDSVAAAADGEESREEALFQPAQHSDSAADDRPPAAQASSASLASEHSAAPDFALDFELPQRLAPEEPPAAPSMPDVVRSRRQNTTTRSPTPTGDKLGFAYDAARALQPDGRQRPFAAAARIDAIAPEDITPEERATADDQTNTDLPFPAPADEEHAAAAAADTTRTGDSSAVTAIPPDDPAAEHADSATPRPASAHVDVNALDARYGPAPQARRQRRGLVNALAALLLLSLGAQLTYLYRTELARQLPALRPVLERACAYLACDVPLPRISSALALESSELEALPAQEGHFVLHFSVNNRAPHAQAWPHVELTLTDARDLPVARRVLAPAEWLPANAAAPAFDSARSVSSSVNFAVRELAPTGYRIYLFYP